MSAIFSRSVTAVSLFLSAGVLFADDSLSWQDCFRNTVSNNLELSIATLKLKEAEAQYKSTRAQAYSPEVSANASRTVGKAESGSSWGNKETSSAGLSASYTLFSGFGDRAKVTQSEAELQAEGANFDQTRANVEYTLRKAFAQQLYAQELITLTEGIASRRADNVRLIEMRYEGGREHKGSLMLKQAQLTDALYSVKEAKRALLLAQRQLATIMGQLNYQPFTLSGELRADPPPSNAVLNELAILTPSYRVAEANLKASEQGFIITRSERFPKIVASSSLSASGDHDLENKSWSAGLALSLPVFTGGRLSQDIIAAGLQREQSRLTAEQTMLSLMNTLQDSLNSYYDSYESRKVQEEQLKAAEMRAEVARAQYQQGLISFQDWDTIETQLITAQKSWLSSRRAADQAEAAWQNAMGLSEIR